MEKKYNDLFIDFDDTLYDTRGNAMQALKETFKAFNLSAHFSDPQMFYDNYWQTNRELWKQYSLNEITRDYLIVERFRRPLSTGTDIDATEEYCLEMSDKFLDFCSCKSGVVEGAYELVDYLTGRGYRLHICSNGFHEVQYKKLESSGLLDHFRTIILSEDAGANKPSLQFFDYAIRQTGANPLTTIMIGDNYDTDITGAMNAGIDTLMFCRWEKDFVAPKPPTYSVNSLLDIKDIL